MFIGYKNPWGYYYLTKSYEYSGLTDKEIEYFPKFIVKKIGEDTGLPADILYLDKHYTQYVKQGVNLVYYVKFSQRYWGKLYLYYRLFGEHFWVQAYFKQRHFQSNTQRVALKKSKYTDHKYGVKKHRDYHKYHHMGREHPTK